MDLVTQELSIVFVYLDDIVVASHNEREHLAHLERLFSCLIIKLPPDLRQESSGVQVGPMDSASVLKSMMSKVKGQESRPCTATEKFVP